MAAASCGKWIPPELVLIFCFRPSRDGQAFEFYVGFAAIPVLKELNLAAR